MRWTSGDRGDIDDLRGQTGGGGIRGGVPLGIGGFVVLLLLSWATGTNWFALVGGGPQTASSPSRTGTSPAEERTVDFVGAVMRDLQDTWSGVLKGRYQPTRLALFRDAVESACGSAEAATGPFYCPGDQKVYLDLSFFDDLKEHLGAPGEFAQAYVVAHEVGHHVQHLLGIDERLRQQASGNAGSVALELQADCFAGVWGHTAAQQGRAAAGKVELDPGDAEQGLAAAARSAMIACSGGRPGASRPKPSPTVRRRSVSSGSVAVSPPGTPMRATPSDAAHGKQPARGPTGHAGSRRQGGRV